MTAPTRKVTRTLLVISLAVNLLLVGLIVGSLAAGRGGPTRGFEPALGPLGQILPKEDRAEIGRDIRRGMRELGRSIPQRREALEAVVAALEADVFDPTAFEAIIRAQQGWQDQVRDVALTAFIAHISDMAVSERQKVARALRERVDRGRRAEGDAEHHQNGN